LDLAGSTLFTSTLYLNFCKIRSAGAQPASTPTSSRRFRYCASANIPPAKECHPELVLIGRFSTLTAISAAPPNT
jgi:hypothetical protein